jgi:hypothetical protein
MGWLVTIDLCIPLRAGTWHPQIETSYKTGRPGFSISLEASTSLVHSHCLTSIVFGIHDGGASDLTAYAILARQDKNRQHKLGTHGGRFLVTSS